MAVILVAGTTKGVGFEIVRALRARDDTVIGFGRSEDAAPKLEELGARLISADARDTRDVATAFREAGPIDAVVCTIGGKTDETHLADWPAARNFTDASQVAGVKRFIFISAIGCGDSRAVMPAPVLERIGEALDAKDQAENYLRASGLDWTIVRPGGFESGSATGNGFLTEDQGVLGGIVRADVAQLVVQRLVSGNAVRRTLAAVDRGKVRTGNGYDEYQLA